VEQHGVQDATTVAEEEPRVIEGNVDNATGNVNASGSLVVQGDVHTGFSVHARGTLEVFGNVEDALIEVEGNVILRQGFTGTGKGKISATGSVTMGHVRNQTVVAGGDVVISSECINATVSAGGRIDARRAVVSGGKLDAMREILLGEVGVVDEMSAKVRVGRRAKVIEQLGVLDKELANAERQLKEVKDAVYKLIKIKVDGGSLPGDKEALLAKLQAAQKMLPERIVAIHGEHAALLAELQKKSDVKVVVYGTIHANTMIEVDGARKILDASVRGVEFTQWSGTLEARSL
jgi:uncharacterized protein